jgi:ribonuclease G
MPKELIVSVNGREKKIAIVEDGRVTEFYIERGEEHQGIVGNIYKGRVMRVLPGMQSAFVDIGLERDAFLYVSDFFDEEEEFERIVVDKTKTEGADAEAAARAAADRIERARIERERQMEAAHERAEPAAGAAPPSAEDEEDEDEEVEEIAAPVVAQPVPVDEEEADAGGRKRRRKRGRERDDEAGAKGRGAPPAEKVASTAGYGLSPEDLSTPFAAGASFERVVDDEAAAEDGAMFKDARLQERLTDQTRAVEFDMDTTATAEVGSVLPTAGAQGFSFERVDDSDAGPDASATRPVQKEVAASVARLVGEFDDEATGSLAGAGSFERVSDEESVSTAGETAARKKGAAKKGAAKKGTKKSASKSAPKAAAKKSSGASKKSAAKGGPRRRKSGGEEGALDEADRESQQEANAADGGAPAEDAQASVKSRPPHGSACGRRLQRPERGG